MMREIFIEITVICITLFSLIAIPVIANTAESAEHLKIVSRSDLQINKNMKVMELVGSLELFSAGDVVIEGDYAYIADGDKRLISVDVSDPENPVFLDSLGEYGSENGVALDVSGDYAFVATEAHGVLIADISNPLNLAIEGRYIYAYAKDIEVVGDYAYVADQDYGLKIVNISNVSMPVETGSVATDGPFGLVIEGNLAYCADNDGGLCIVNIAPPDNPTIEGECHPFHNMRRIGFHNSHIYSDYDYSLDIINVSDPLSPSSLGAYPVYCRAIAIYDDYAYIAMGYMGQGIVVLDLADPSSPVVVDSIAIGYPTLGIAVDEKYVYVAASEMLFIYSKPTEYICGDSNSDEVINVSDAVWIVNYVFIGGDPPYPLESGDTNCDDFCNISDAVWIVNYVFVGGNKPCDTDGDQDPDC